jgi:hypothetical protein
MTLAQTMQGYPGPKAILLVLLTLLAIVVLLSSGVGFAFIWFMRRMERKHNPRGFPIEPSEKPKNR